MERGTPPRSVTNGNQDKGITMPLNNGYTGRRRKIAEKTMRNGDVLTCYDCGDPATFRDVDARLADGREYTFRCPHPTNRDDDYLIAAVGVSWDQVRVSTATMSGIKTLLA